MSFNPYQPPTSAYDGSYTNYGNTGAAVSDRTVAALRKTRPWVMFIAITIFVFAGIAGLAGLAGLATSGADAIGTLIAAGLYALPAAALLRYANAINKLLHGGGVAELEKSMDAQASFWQIAGIFMLIAMILVVIAVIAAVLIGASFAGLMK